MGAIHSCHMVTTDASMTDWGAVFKGRPAHGVWTIEILSWHINCLPGTDSLSPPSQEVSCDSQDGQHGGGNPHKLPRGFTVTHPKQACAPSSPLVSGQVPLLESSSHSGSFELCS